MFRPDPRQELTVTLTLIRGGVIVAALGLAAFGLWTAWTAFRSPINHPYWWAFVSLLGAPVTTFDWASGHVSTQLLSLQLLNAGFIIDPTTAVATVSLAFPAGALLFRQRRRQLVLVRFPLRPDDQLPP